MSVTTTATQQTIAMEQDMKNSGVPTESKQQVNTKYNRRASATDKSITQTSKWRMLEIHQLPNNICWLSHDDRLKLYNKVSKNFTIVTTNNNQYCQSVTGLSHSKLASLLSNNSTISDITTIFSLGIVFQGSYLLSLWLFYIGAHLLWNNHCYSFYIYCLVVLALLFIPHKEWELFSYNPISANWLKYFSYRIAYHPKTYEYLLKYYKKTHLIEEASNSNNSDNNNNNNNTGNNNNNNVAGCIILGVPHGIQPLSISLSPSILTDIFGGKFRFGAASVLFYLPFLRSIFLWWGLVDASKNTLLERILRRNENIHLVADGISGMFEKSSKNEELILLKKRKGIAKLALETGCHVIPSYGFGNTDIFKPHFDPFGIMKMLSKRLRMSLILTTGRWYTPIIPQKVPLYYAIGKIVENEYAGQRIVKPTKDQIDEYHDRILDGLKQTFDTHKHIYGWSNKQMVLK